MQQSENEEKPVDENFLKGIMGLAEQINALNDYAYAVYLPLVDELIASKRKDANEIEHLLDKILDIASSNKGLLLFKRLCRYYWEIDKVSTAEYIQIYRELWDSDSLEEDEK